MTLENIESETGDSGFTDIEGRIATTFFHMTPTELARYYNTADKDIQAACDSYVKKQTTSFWFRFHYALHKERNSNHKVKSYNSTIVSNSDGEDCCAD